LLDALSFTFSSKSSENVLPKKYVSIHPEVKKDSLQMAVNQATREAWQSFVNRSSD